MRLFIIALAIFLVSSCDHVTYRKSCNSKNVQEWVLRCIKNGNPYSDEEPEALVRECWKRGKDLVCAVKPFLCNHHSMEEIPCDKVVLESHIDLCKSHLDFFSNKTIEEK